MTDILILTIITLSCGEMLQALKFVATCGSEAWDNPSRPLLIRRTVTTIFTYNRSGTWLNWLDWLDSLLLSAERLEPTLTSC
jgi:hypothetical protein